MNRCAALAAAISIACTAGLANANAAPSPEISLDIERCPALPRDEVLRQLPWNWTHASSRLPRPRPGPRRRPRRPRPPRSPRDPDRIACDGPAVQTTVVDPITGKQLTRTMDLPAQGSSAVAARAVALGAAELVITSWMELTMSPRAERAPEQPPSSPAASEELRRAAQDRALRRAGREGGAARVLVLGQAAGPFTGMGLGWGGGLRLGWTFARRWLDRAETSGRPGIALELTETRADADAGPAAGSVRASTWRARRCARR